MASVLLNIRISYRWNAVYIGYRSIECDACVAAIYHYIYIYDTISDIYKAIRDPVKGESERKRKEVDQ